jgi:hypothetical protein
MGSAGERARPPVQSFFVLDQMNRTEPNRTELHTLAHFGHIPHAFVSTLRREKCRAVINLERAQNVAYFQSIYINVRDKWLHFPKQEQVSTL